MRDVKHQAAALSSGTLASLSGERLYDRLDKLHAEFLEAVDRYLDSGPLDDESTWQEAWAQFVSEAGFLGARLAVFKSAEESRRFVAHKLGAEVRLTVFDGAQPIGHTVWPDMVSAAASALGRFVNGEPPVGASSFRVVEVRQ